MPFSRPCPSELPGHLSGYPGLCSFCLREHLCTHSSAPTHLQPWPIWGMVALSNPGWKEVETEGAGPPLLHLCSNQGGPWETDSRQGQEWTPAASVSKSALPESLSPSPCGFGFSQPVCIMSPLPPAFSM